MFWKLCYHLIRASLYCMAVPCFRLKVHGKEHVPPAGSAMLVSNHASYLDPILIGVAAPRRINYLAKKELFSNPIFSFILRTICGALPVDRDQLDRNTLREVLHLLQGKEMLLVFPEGTRTHDGKLGEAKLGVGMIAYSTKAAVIPAYIKGSFDILSRTSRRVHCKNCTVFFGPPVQLDDFYGQAKSRELYKEIGRRIMESIRTLEVKASSAEQTENSLRILV